MARIRRRAGDATSPSVALSFEFAGDLANDGQLNFYEASRFMYGASRFVYILEHYRQTGEVVEQVRKRIDADFRIRAPQPGSWVLDVMAVVAPVVGSVPKSFLDVPLKVLASWLINKITGGKINLAETLLALEEERTKQSREETRRLSIHAQSSNRLLDLLEREIAKKDEAVNRHIDDIREARIEAEVQSRLEHEIAPYQARLNRISKSDQQQLMARARSQVVEMARPLRHSASQLLVGGKPANQKTAFITRRTVDAVEGNAEDTESVEIIVNVIRYDKESGWGKFRQRGQRKQISFYIPSSQRSELKGEILDAMKVDAILLTTRYVRDTQGVIKHARVEDISLIEEEDEE